MDWNTDFIGRTLRGNLGVRYVDTDQTSSGFAVVNNTPVPATVERELRRLAAVAQRGLGPHR